jgi:hypothetical protein
MSEGEGGDFKSVVKAGTGAITEVAKAHQEQQKTIQMGLELVGRAGTFLGGVFGPASQELGHLFGDQMKYWRFKNAVNILEKAQAYVEKRGLKPEQVKALRFGDGLLLLEASSLEEEETVQDLWARLMANAVDPSSPVRPEKMYIDILKSLSGREVVFLNLLAKIEASEKARVSYDQLAALQREISDLAATQWRCFPKAERNASIQNLVRLRCVAPRSRPLNLHWLFEPIADGDIFGSGLSAVKPHEVERVLHTLFEQQLIASGVLEYDTEDRGWSVTGVLPEAAFALTTLGHDLLRACEPGEAAGVC